MARPFWKGSINFGLVNIPVQLYTAVKKHVIGFRLLHEKCGNPIMNKRWCPHCDEEVAWNHILKGLPLKDGSYFVLDQASLHKLKPLKTNNINILEFVSPSQIPSLYLDEHYYVGSGNLRDRTYALFCQALKKTKLVAIGQFVMREKEHICLIEPYNSILLLTTLHFSYEIQDDSVIAEKVQLSPTNKQELGLATLLIDQLYNNQFDLSKYKDTFAQKILKALTSEAGKKALVKSLKSEKPAKKDQSTSLIDLLKQSVHKK